MIASLVVSSLTSHWHTHTHTFVCLFASGWISLQWITSGDRVPALASKGRRECVGLKHDTLMIWRASKDCTPPHLFFFFFFLLLQNFVCDRPCRIGLFVPQNSRELAEKHHRADSQRVSSGGGGAHSGWTPTWDIPWRWSAVNKHPKPKECKARNPVWDRFNFGW